MADTVFIAQVSIDSRFHGPKSSGNGGYSCGIAARFIDGPAEVTLRAPPPLETPLDVVRDSDTVVLRAGAQDIVQAKPARPDVDPPPAPTRAQAEEATKLYRGRTQHYFPTCFACGLDHPTGLHLAPGAFRADIVACPWTPAADLAGADGKIADEFLWAALDCPSYWALPRAGEVTCVLGRLTGEIHARPALGAQLTIAAWPLGAEGRKHASATAIYDEQGRVIARARALWIEVKPEQFQ